MCCRENNFQWCDKKGNAEVQFQQCKFSLEISKILNDKSVSALLQIPG